MRVIGGTLGGRRLLAPTGRSTRPTSDRVREALFNILAPWIAGSSVLDLFAGSGALAIEALSRGAARAVLVERDPGALSRLRSNLSALGLGERTRILARDALAAWEGLAAGREAFDLVFLDPPYDSDLVTRALQQGLEQNLLAVGGRIVVEFRWILPPEVPAGWQEVRRARYGETGLLFLEREANRP